jgi:L-threonylcarbamoyladenylate synthase
VDLRDPQRPAILRPGGISAAELEPHLGRPLAHSKRPVSPSPGREGQIAPGLLARHYSPRTPLTLHDRMASVVKARSQPSEAFVYLHRPDGDVTPNIFWLDPQGELAGVARRLFAVLRKVDAMKFRRIHVERPVATGLGLAINDRLTRAAAR